MGNRALLAAMLVMLLAGCQGRPPPEPSIHLQGASGDFVAWSELVAAGGTYKVERISTGAVVADLGPVNPTPLLGDGSVAFLTGSQEVTVLDLVTQARSVVRFEGESFVIPVAVSERFAVASGAAFHAYDIGAKRLQRVPDSLGLDVGVLDGTHYAWLDGTGVRVVDLSSLRVVYNASGPFDIARLAMPYLVTQRDGQLEIVDLEQTPPALVRAVSIPAGTTWDTGVGRLAWLNEQRLHVHDISRGATREFGGIPGGPELHLVDGFAVIGPRDRGDEQAIRAVDLTTGSVRLLPLG